MARSPRRGALAVLAALMLALAFAAQASAATYNVDTTHDDVFTDCTDAPEDCSLRGAIDNANGSADDDKIVVPAGVYRFSGDFGALSVGPNDGDNGALMVEGAGSADTIIDADGNSRVLDVVDSTLEISGVTLRDGNAQYQDSKELATIETQGDEALVTLADNGGTVRLGIGPLPNSAPEFGCIADQSGSGIRAIGSELTLVDTVVSHNNAGDKCGAAGGILNAFGHLSLVRTTVHRNSALVAGGGIVNFLGLLETEDSTVSDNLGGIIGGGVLSVGRFGIESSTISGNLSYGTGGGVLGIGFPAESAPEQGPGALVGGDLFAFIGGDSTIGNSTFSDNVAMSDGGALTYADIRGAISGASVAVCPAPEVTLTNENPCGPPPRPEGAKLTVLDTTFADNAAHAESSIIGLNPFLSDDERGGSILAAGALDIGNSVIADGTTRGAADNCTVTFAPWIESLGNNIESSDSCFLDEAKNDKVNQELRLGDLRDNGGPTKTRALRAGSPAIDNYAGEACGEVDQRGGARPPEGGSAGENCDAGAYEANSLADLSVDSHTDAPDPATAGSPLTYSIVVRNSGPDAIKGVKVTDALPAGVELVSAPNWDLGTLESGESRTLQVVVRPTAPGALSATATVGAPGMTDTKPSNDSAAATTQVGAAQQQQPQQQQQQVEGDSNVDVNLKVPKTASLDEFMDGILVEADCKDEPCLRRFREHAAINTGASHIAGFNLTVSRGFLARSSKRTKLRLRPCESGVKKGSRHQRCLKNLRKSAKKAGKFKVKVVVSVVDAAGNKDYAKKYVTIEP